MYSGMLTAWLTPAGALTLETESAPLGFACWLVHGKFKRLRDDGSHLAPSIIFFFSVSFATMSTDLYQADWHGRGFLGY